MATNALLAVRAVTAFVVLEKGGADAWTSPLSRAIEFVAKLAASIRDRGYDVQTLRVITNPFAEWIDTSESEAALAGLRELRTSSTASKDARERACWHPDSIFYWSSDVAGRSQARACTHSRSG